MIRKFLLLDANNLYYRSLHVTHGTKEDKAGLGLHIILQSIKTCFEKFQNNHLVVALDGKSWRKSVYPAYKANRLLRNANLSVREIEDQKYIFECINDFTEFLKTKTNVTVLSHEKLEADDLISGWIQHYPEDAHLILSSDSDYRQLLAPNVNQYDPIKEYLYTIEGILDKKNKPVINKKTNQPELIDPEWLLFEKCIRGDSSDNVFSAYPGVRKKALQLAYLDRDKKGFDWNNVMMNTWKDHRDQEHKVLDRYMENRSLIDLRAQPDDIKNIIDSTIKNVTQIKNPQIGVNFLKFCHKHNLANLSKYPDQIVKILGASLCQ